MHVHKPKAVASLREFLSEILVIVVGIAIALMGEQVVEWIHWRHEVAEVRASLNEELAHDVGVMRFRESQSACVDARAADLDRFVAAWRRGRAPVLAGPIGGPFLYVYATDAWAVAQSSPALLHMPLRERLEYEHIYKTLRFLEERRLAEAAVWDELPQYVGARRLGEAELIRLTGLAYRARLQRAYYAFNAPFVETFARRLHLRADTLHGVPEVVRDLCRPMSF